jgi:hypothetical protein
VTDPFAVTRPPGFTVQVAVVAADDVVVRPIIEVTVLTVSRTVVSRLRMAEPSWD